MRSSASRTPARRKEPLADASLVIAIASGLVGTGSMVGGIFAACGIGAAGAVVCGIAAVKRVSASEGLLRGKATAIAGIVLGSVYLVLVVWLLAWVIHNGSWGTTVPTTPAPRP